MNKLVTALEIEATRYRNKIAALEHELKMTQAEASAGKTPKMSNAEKQRRYRQRKAAKARVAIKPDAGLIE